MILKLLVKEKGLVRYTNRIELNRENLSALADIFYTPVLTVFKDFNTSIDLVLIKLNILSGQLCSSPFG